MTTKQQLATALTAAALGVAPAAALAQPQDLRSPDTRDAAAAQTQSPAPPSQDLRSPDARDNAVGYSPSLPPEPVTASVSSPSGDGFDWVSAALGAGAGALLLLALMGGVSVKRAHRPAGGHA